MLDRILGKILSRKWRPRRLREEKSGWSEESEIDWFFWGPVKLGLATITEMETMTLFRIFELHEVINYMEDEKIGNSKK